MFTWPVRNDVSSHTYFCCQLKAAALEVVSFECGPSCAGFHKITAISISLFRVHCADKFGSRLSRCSLAVIVRLPQDAHRHVHSHTRFGSMPSCVRTGCNQARSTPLCTVNATTIHWVLKRFLGTSSQTHMFIVRMFVVYIFLGSCEQFYSDFLLDQWRRDHFPNSSRWRWFKRHFRCQWTTASKPIDHLLATRCWWHYYSLPTDRTDLQRRRWCKLIASVTSFVFVYRHSVLDEVLMSPGRIDVIIPACLQIEQA